MMPWQRLVLDTAMELDADGHPAYRRVVLTVPRQSGKTTLQLALFVHRALAWGSPQVMVYAAQTGKDARKKLIDPPNGQIPMLSRSPFRTKFKPRSTNGHEAILWKNGSRHGIAANTEKSGHGDTLDLGFIDEAFSQTDARLEQAMSPAMATRPDAQLWIVSTAGDASSIYLKSKVDAGRAHFGDTDGGTAYFEWSAPDDADLWDEDVWWGCMPALGITQTVGTTRAEIRAMVAEGNEPEARRAYLNQWRNDMTSTDPLANWPRCASADARVVTPRALAVDVSLDGRSAALALWGDGVVEVAYYREGEGLGWVPPLYAELVTRYGLTAHGYAKGSPAAALASLLPSGAVAIPSDATAEACGSFAGMVADGTVAQRIQAPLDKAVGGATRVAAGDRWRWSRRASIEAKGVDISPLWAVVLAAHLGATADNTDRSTEGLLRSLGLTDEEVARALADDRA